MTAHHAAEPPGDRWRQRLPEEVRFWDDYVRTRGLEWPDEYQRRVDPDAPFVEQEILARLPADATAPIRILDVGAGPLTVLGTRVPGRVVEITPIDPLADEYARILAHYGVHAPVPTRKSEGESIARQFNAGTFDFAYARNALDHSRDPRSVICQMVQVVKPGGYVVLRHRPNEAIGAAYAGLHQWNFDVRGGRFVIWNEQVRHDMSRVLWRRGDLTCHRDGEWLVCVVRRLTAAERARRSVTALFRRRW